MARRKSNNDALTTLVTALIALPIVIAIVFKFIFKALAELVEFIGKCAEKHQQSKLERDNSYRGTMDSEPKRTRNSAYGNSYSTERNTDSKAYRAYQSENGACDDDGGEAERCFNLYQALRAPGDPDPDFSLTVADEFETYEDELDDEEIMIDADDIFLAEAFDNVSESDIEIMGLALYDALMHHDD